MIKNTAGQKVGAQMITASDGSSFSGAVVVEVTIDAGTQATGTVGSGACTHEGNGYHTYAPSQAETNGDLIAFTFHGTGAVSQTVQIYARAATPDVNVAAMAAGVVTATAIAADAIGASELAADAVTEIQAGLSTLTQANIRTAVGLASANLDTQLSTIDDFLDTEVAAIKTVTDKLAFLYMYTGTIANASASAPDLGTLGLADNELNDHLLTIFDNSAAEYHARWITAFTGATSIVAIDSNLPFTTESGVDTFVVWSIRRDPQAATALTNIATITGKLPTNKIMGSSTVADKDDEIDAIKAVTDAITATGTGLTAIPWNAAWDAEVQSEAADALNVYDAPTKAELDAAVAPLSTFNPVTTDVSVDNITSNAAIDILKQALSSTEAVAVGSLAWACAMLLNKKAFSGSDLIVYKSNGATEWFRVTVATDPAAEPIVSTTPV